MLMIEMRKTEDGTTEFYIWSGEKVPRGFTPETDQDQIAVFHKLLNDNEETIFSSLGNTVQLLNVIWNYSRLRGRERMAYLQHDGEAIK